MNSDYYYSEEQDAFVRIDSDEDPKGCTGTAMAIFILIVLVVVGLLISVI